MTEAILEWIRNTFTANPYWVTAIISVIPTIEVRGAITVGIGLGLHPAITWVFSCISALVICPILLLCLKPVLNILKRVKIFKKLADGLEDMFASKARKIAVEQGVAVKESSIVWKKALGVFLFVAIPLPLTGVWTGSAVAAFLDLKYRYSVPAIILGNFTAGGIITLLNLLLGKYSGIIIIALMVFCIISIISVCTTIAIKNKKKTPSSKEKENDVVKDE